MSNAVSFFLEDLHYIIGSTVTQPLGQLPDGHLGPSEVY